MVGDTEAEERKKRADAAQEWLRQKKKQEERSARGNGAAEPTEGPHAYSYSSPLPPDHFVSRWISYAKGRTDAALEYHEAAALVLLAAATPTVRAKLGPYPTGLPTNLYCLLIGDTTVSRKSTAKDFARDAQDRALPGSICPDHFSPEGFIETMAGRPHDSATWFIDEFGGLVDKLNHAKHMSGLKELLMTVYGGANYTYRRHSKRNRDGDKIHDEDTILGPHLSILGATTPAIFERLTEPDVTSGLLPRFAIINPTVRPHRRKLSEIVASVEAPDADLVVWLNKLHTWARTPSKPVHFEDGVLDQIDAIAIEIEKDAGNRTPAAAAMLERLVPMTIKVSMLTAAGYPWRLDCSALSVATDDATAAITIARRWMLDALTFAEKVGENDFERKLQRCATLVQSKKLLPRRDVARQCHTDKRTLDMIQDTLVDRGLIELVSIPANSGPNVLKWRSLSL